MKFRQAYGLVFSVALIAATVSSCSVIADAPNNPSTVQNVGQYYYPLEKIGIQYCYLRKTPLGSDTVQMTMMGNDAQPAALTNNMACFSADLHKAGSFTNNLYFSVSDSEAFSVGKTFCAAGNNYWLDLKAPLTEHQQWTFYTSSYYSPGFVTATVLRRGAKLKMPDGRVFDDVTQVSYVSSNADTTVKWFARGVGLIYTSSNHTDYDFGDQLWFINPSK